MTIGIVEISFITHGCFSLKEKRSIVKRLIERTRSRFNAAIAEVDFLDSCQRGKIGACVVSNDSRHANSLLDQIVDFMENMYVADIVKIRTELQEIPSVTDPGQLKEKLTLDNLYTL